LTNLGPNPTGDLLHEERGLRPALTNRAAAVAANGDSV
jgi:hypothetical protein